MILLQSSLVIGSAFQFPVSRSYLQTLKYDTEATMDWLFNLLCLSIFFLIKIIYDYRVKMSHLKSAQT